MYIYFGGKNPFNIKDLAIEGIHIFYKLEKTSSPPKPEGISFKIASNKT